MQEPRIEKLTLNIGAGTEKVKLDKGMKLLEKISSSKPVKTVTNKRLAAWGLRPGLPIGCKVTLRGKKAEELLKRLLEAKDNRLTESQIDDNGNIAFGIHEYIEIPGVGYEPEIGVMGLQVCVSLEKPGYRVKKRKVKRSTIGAKHKLRKNEAVEFVKKKFNVDVGGEE